MIRFLGAAALAVTASQVAAARLRDSGTGPGLTAGQGTVWPLLCILLAVCLVKIGSRVP